MSAMYDGLHADVVSAAAASRQYPMAENGLYDTGSWQAAAALAALLRCRQLMMTSQGLLKRGGVEGPAGEAAAPEPGGEVVALLVVLVLMVMVVSVLALPRCMERGMYGGGVEEPAGEVVALLLVLAVLVLLVVLVLALLRCIERGRYGGGVEEPAGEVVAVLAAAAEERDAETGMEALDVEVVVFSARRRTLSA